MEIEYQNSKKDWIDFQKQLLKDKLKEKAAYLFFLSLFVTLAFNSDSFSWSKTLIVLFIYIILIASTYYFIPLYLSITELNKLTEKEYDFEATRKYIVTEDGLVAKSSTGEVTRSWSSMQFAGFNAVGIYIKLVDKNLLMIGNKNFKSEAEATNFLGLLQLNIRNHSGLVADKGNSYVNKGKPLYLLGLLGFIPIVGAFVGVVLILYGLIKYRDKILVIIGLGCIVFTLFVYRTLFYASEGGSFENEFAKMDTMILNGLIKDIEFYKIQNGTYPDNLEQLDSNGMMVNFSDPLLSDPENNKFNYYRFGKRYTLYSSGVDKKANTADDIYPTVKIDTNKIGLIIKRKSAP
jgi:hypothetical protein